MSKEFLAWLRAASVRAVKTFAQAMLAVLALGQAGTGVLDVDWRAALGVAALASVMSLLTSVAGLPEVKEQPSSSGNSDPHRV